MKIRNIGGDVIDILKLRFFKRRPRLLSVFDCLPESSLTYSSKGVIVIFVKLKQEVMVLSYFPQSGVVETYIAKPPRIFLGFLFAKFACDEGELDWENLSLRYDLKYKFLTEVWSGVVWFSSVGLNFVSYDDVHGLNRVIIGKMFRRYSVRKQK